MRVLMWLRPGAQQIPGGHVVQLHSTAAALRDLGVTVTVSCEPEPDLNGIDVLHGMGLAPAMIRRARQRRIPVAVSTIYWSKAYYVGQTQQTSLPKRVEWLSRLAVSSARRGVLETSSRVLAPITAKIVEFEAADLLLPNSHAEADAIGRELAVSTPMHVVPNAVDETTFKASDRPRSGVIYVGRIEPHKNQLGLLRATRDGALPVTIVGKQHPHHPDYYAACRKASGPNVTFVDGRDQSGLVDLYQRAAVHAMPSWFETTGLASLEAALCGCRIVSTDRGYAKEYFEDLAWYCNPADDSSIRSAIDAALAAPPSSALSDRILGRYTWRHTASATIAGYERLLA